MKTFEDLEFKDHPNSMYGYSTQAEMSFENGYGVSVITGKNAYSDASHPYEIAVIKNGYICFDTYITDDVIGYCDSDNVTSIMKKIQELK